MTFTPSGRCVACNQPWDSAQQIERLTQALADERAAREKAERERDIWVDDCNTALDYLKDARAERDAANARIRELEGLVAAVDAAAVEAMGRRLHIIDHGAEMPPFELCQAFDCETRWMLINAAVPERRFWAIQDWRKEHPNYAPPGWQYGVQMPNERDFRATHLNRSAD